MISIVIPTFNRVDSLQKCINSILPQVYNGLQIVVVDDHSTDLTAEYLRSMNTAYPFIDVVSNAKNFGVNYTRNRGIEKSTQRFILFLDSDDWLATDVLGKVLLAINSNPGTTHFLFTVSDRAEEFSNVTGARSVHYGDWICGTINGDFVHVVDSSIMKKFLFFEQFRMYEHLNWLRVHKCTSPQLMFSDVVTERERGRPDSLTLSAKLQTPAAIQAKFEAQLLYYSMYYKDLSNHRARSLSFKLLKSIALGVACDKRNESRQLIKYANHLLVRIVARLIVMLPSRIAMQGIIGFSSLK